MLLGSRSTGGVMAISMATGGSGYTSPPTVTVSGGGGAGVTAVAHMAGTMVESVQIVSAGTGHTSQPSVSFSGGGGTGAAATATVYSGALRPMAFFKGRRNEVYGVDGMGRGVRWDGVAAALSPIGLQKPCLGPSMTASSTGGGKFVAGVQMVNAGGGYIDPPTVTISGGSATRDAKAEAYISDGRVAQIRITDGGAGYQSTPTVTIGGGIGSGAAFTVACVGAVAGLYVTAQGTGYTANATTAPTVVFSTAQGLTNAAASVVVNARGEIAGVNLLSGGTGATAAGVTATITGGGGTGAELRVGVKYGVSAVTVASSGSGYYAAPVLTFRAAPEDPEGFGAAATVFSNATGNITGVTVFSAGSYLAPPTALILDTTASATASLAASFGGKYLCCLRYLDDTSPAQGGPLPSSISELVEIEASVGSGGLTWTLSHAGLDARVHAAELWRTTADQAVLLYRVATILRSSAQFTGTYVDTLTDDELIDTSRAGYGLMPVTLPSGQINARRFQVPPPEFAVACMFQDRAWFAVDTTGVRPNALMYSEIDEPESVPDVNELVIQENTDTPDRLVALVPLGSQLLLVQTTHIYKLNYVAQPVLDASIVLGAYRGVLNNQCWSVLGGVAFLVDSNGMYAYDGTAEEPVSVAVDDYWRNGIIDFSKADKFHVRSDAATKVVRLFYCQASDSLPTRALCYCVATKAWWEETYSSAITTSCQVLRGGRIAPIYGTSGGAFVKESGTSDAGAPVPYAYRSGAMALADEEGRRAVDVTYRPTQSDATVLLALHYNNSSSPRPNAVASDTGTGFATTAGGTAASLNMKTRRSALGDATGRATAYFSGRNDRRSSGADKHISIALSGQQSSEPVIVYGLDVEGVK